MKTSVLIPSFQRPDSLRRCLSSLATQTTAADELIVVWQEEDLPTREAAERMRTIVEPRSKLMVTHHERRGVVPAENAALARAGGEIVLLIDDDAVAPADWVSRHVRHYTDPSIGAVGGPADNFRPDGTPFPKRAAEPVGRVSWLGRMHGNMFDQPLEWRTRPPREVDQLVGYNMSLRRAAFHRFADQLRPYWQSFELDACLQARQRGYRLLFDFENVVAHYPTNTAYVAGRDGDLDVKVFNAAYNQSYVLARHTHNPIQRWLRAAYQLGVGSVNAPGLVASLVAMRRYGFPRRELSILARTWRARREAYRDATRERRLETRDRSGIKAGTA